VQRARNGLDDWCPQVFVDDPNSPMAISCWLGAAWCAAW